MGAGQSKTELFKYFSVNSVGVLNVLEAARLAEVNNIIFFSSLTVYGFDQHVDQGKKEADNFLSLHPYATSKIVGEYFIKDYTRFYKMNAVVLKPSIIVGNMEGEPNALNEFLQNTLKNEPIVIYGNGQHQREYLSIRDLGKAVNCSVNIIKELNQDGYYEDFIVSSSKPISMEELAKLIIQITGKGKIKKIEKNSKSFSLTSNTEKIRRIMDWKPNDNIEDMITQVKELLD